jgi:hypothetical protein
MGPDASIVHGDTHTRIDGLAGLSMVWYCLVRCDSVSELTGGPTDQDPCTSILTVQVREYVHGRVFIMAVHSMGSLVPVSCVSVRFDECTNFAATPVQLRSTPLDFIHLRVRSRE